MSSTEYGTYTFSICDALGGHIRELTYILNAGTDNSRVFRARLKADYPESKGMRIVSTDSTILVGPMTVGKFMESCGRDEQDRYVVKLEEPFQYLQEVNSSTESLANEVQNMRAALQLNNM
ncbi:hypothetical protein GGF42_007666 [Coemansia sp. RSA 2424]|nr:hypothetical protein GGF42_007666 [Coemansia sp. RSA 2424]